MINILGVFKNLFFNVQYLRSVPYSFQFIHSIILSQLGVTQKSGRIPDIAAGYMKKKTADMTFYVGLAKGDRYTFHYFGTQLILFSEFKETFTFQ